MKCKLCGINEANATNSHCLTDAIIRKTLNVNGRNDREYGLFFNFDSTEPFIEGAFQRNTPIEKIKEILGREPNEKEIEAAKKNPYTVDNLFCRTCEKKFSEIETKFIQQIYLKLPKYYEDKIVFKNPDEIILIRLFFFLQVWRMHECGEISLPTETADRLRNFILNYEKISLDKLKNFPILAIFLEVKGELKEYTTNLVGIIEGENPYILLMGDLVILFYTDYSTIKFEDIYGLVKEDEFDDIINFKEKSFIIKKINNQERKNFLLNVQKSEIEKKFTILSELFKVIYYHYYNVYPNEDEIKKCYTLLLNNYKVLSKENFIDCFNKHFLGLY